MCKFANNLCCDLSPPFSREDLGGLVRNTLGGLLHHVNPNQRNPVIRLICDSDNYYVM